MCKNKTELNKLVKKYRRLKRDQELLDKSLSEVKEEIKAYVREHGELTNGNPGDPISFRGVDYKLLLLTLTRDNIDTKLLKATLGDKEYSKYNRPTSYDCLRVS